MKSNSTQPTAQATPVDPLTATIRAAVASEIDRLRDELAEIVSARPLPRYLDTSEVSQMLGTTSQTVRRLRDEGMPHVLIGDSCYRYDPAQVREWLAARAK